MKTGGNMKTVEKERIVAIRSPKGEVVCLVESWRFHTIVNVLRQGGATKPEAEAIAEWAARGAKPGKQMTTWTGYAVEIEGDADDSGNV